MTGKHLSRILGKEWWCVGGGADGRTVTTINKCQESDMCLIVRADLIKLNGVVTIN
jgi:hypothetical protein